MKTVTLMAAVVVVAGALLARAATPPVRPDGDPPAPVRPGQTAPAADSDQPASETKESGQWKYTLVISAKGTRSEGRLGMLVYGDKPVEELTQAQRFDRIQTPWGVMRYLGPRTGTFGNWGWLVKLPEGTPPQDKGRLLTLPADSPGAGARLQLTQADSGKTVQATVGQEIVVTLDGNITTGYSWTQPKIVGDAVRQSGKIEYVQRPAPGGIVGVGGHFKATLRAVKAGQATLTLEHRRPWEKDKPAEETFTLTVEVKAAAKPAPDSPARAEGEQGAQGVQGRVLKLSGNFMPSVGGPPGGRTQPLAVPVHVFKGPLKPLAKPDPQHPALVKIVQADKDGRYRLALPPGIYTVVAEIDGKLYLNLFLGGGTWGTVTVEKGKWTDWDIRDTSDAAF